MVKSNLPVSQPRPWYLKKRFIAAALAAALLLAQALGAPVAPTIAKLIPIVLSVVPDETPAPLPTPAPGDLLNQGDDDPGDQLDRFRARLDQGLSPTTEPAE